MDLCLLCTYGIYIMIFYSCWLLSHYQIHLQLTQQIRGQSCWIPSLLLPSCLFCSSETLIQVICKVLSPQSNTKIYDSPQNNFGHGAFVTAELSHWSLCMCYYQNLLEQIGWRMTFKLEFLCDSVIEFLYNVLFLLN